MTSRRVCFAVDGHFEGGPDVSAGRRMNGEHHHERAQHAVSHRTCLWQQRRPSLKQAAGAHQRERRRLRCAVKTLFAIGELVAR